MIRKIFSNTFKQISRAGWTAWASVSVMTLAFLVAIIFGGLAFVSNLYISFIESKSNILVFFEEGMDKEVVDNLQAKWVNNPKVKSITYTSEEDAYQIYSDYTAVVQKEIYAVLKTKENKKLPSSLDIQIYSLEELQSLKSELEVDIEEANATLVKPPTNEGQEDTVSGPVEYLYSQDPTQKPVVLKVDDESLDQLRQVLYFLRLVGIIVLVILFVGIFFFAFMTVEFRLQSQMDEIGVMQLVGGSLFFIRSPYVLEGGFYGLMGAFLSSLMIFGFLMIVFVFNSTSTVAVFLYEILNKLNWPYVSNLGWVGIIGGICLVGFLLGSVSSYLSIRRYIR